MLKGNRIVNERGNAKGRKGLALALLMVLLLAVLIFLFSDAAFVKNARDSLMGRLGYVSEDVSGDEYSGTDEAEEYENSEGAGPDDKFVSDEGFPDPSKAENIDVLDASDLPKYNGYNYVTVNGNVPDFPEEIYAKAGLVKDGDNLKTEGNLFGTVESGKIAPYEFYSPLDDHGRCRIAYGCLGRETMPEEGAERGDISDIHPSGWAKGQNWERSHLIAWSLSAENANKSNLITGTHYFNHDGMRPFEEMTAHYIWRSGGHVLYMCEPVYKGNELVARGVHMMARSVEDNGEDLAFNIYCFNVTPGADIDYKSGIVTTEAQASQDARLYVVNKRSRVFHYPSCDGAKSMSGNNREEVTASRSELIEEGYTPCGSCQP